MKTAAPKPYQEDGIAFLASRRTALLGDDAGLGKSLQLIRAADQIKADRIIIVCPAIGRVSWRDQLATWQTLPRLVLRWPHPSGHIPTGPVALVVTYDWLASTVNRKKFNKSLDKADPFHVLICDECHYLKSPGAKRTQAVYGNRTDGVGGLVQRVPRTWIASGTPMPNHAGELYSHLRALFPDTLVDALGQIKIFQAYRDEYCLTDETPFGIRIVGNRRENIPSLKAKLATHVLVRKKTDVLKDLDPIRPVPLPLEVQVTTDENDTTLAAQLDAAEALELDETIALRSLALSSDSVSTRRHALGLLKVEPAVKWVQDFLMDQTKKLVIFAHHRDVIEKLAAELAPYNPVTLTGKTNPEAKARAVVGFQTKAHVRVFIGQTIAAGTSITLTAASDVLLLEPDWTPANNYQAISRCHRIGQQNSVTAWFAFAEGTIDRRISTILRRKAADAAQLFGANAGELAHR